MPEGHDLASNLRRSQFTDVDGTSSESKTLGNTDDDTTTNEGADAVARGEGLDESRDNGEESSDSDTDTSTSKIGQWTTHEPTGCDSTNGVRCVDRTDQVAVRVVEVGDPVLTTLHIVSARSYETMVENEAYLNGVEDTGVETVHCHGTRCHQRDVPVVRPLVGEHHVWRLD